MIARNRPRKRPGVEASSLPARTQLRRVLLIDYDRQLSEVFGDLLAGNDLEVISHNCPRDRCTCVEKTLETQPDLVLVNVAQPSGWMADSRGWHCLQRIASDPRTKAVPALGYAIFDSYTLADMGFNLQAGPILRLGVTNPGLFADEIARSLHRQAVGF